MRRVSRPVATSTTQRSLFRTKATRVPSGDASANSSASGVCTRARTAAVLASTVKTSPAAGTRSVWPSGSQDAAASGSAVGFSPGITAFVPSRSRDVWPVVTSRAYRLDASPERRRKVSRFPSGCHWRRLGSVPDSEGSELMRSTVSFGSGSAEAEEGMSGSAKRASRADAKGVAEERAFMGALQIRPYAPRRAKGAYGR